MKIFVLYRPTHTDRCIVILEETSVVRTAPPNFHTVSTYSYGKIESMLSNFRNVIERHSNSSAHGSPPPHTRHGSVEQNCGTVTVLTQICR